MRDHGCYFLAGTPEEVAMFRDSCGKFKVESVSKMMSRMGQVSFLKFIFFKNVVIFSALHSHEKLVSKLFVKHTLKFSIIKMVPIGLEKNTLFRMGLE